MTKPSPSMTCAVHAEIVAAVAHQFVHFLEGAFVEQQVDALAGGEFAFLVLAGAALFASAVFGRSVPSAQFFDSIGHNRPE